jgi:TM2 domain-containing membrane protein YozV
MALIRLTCPRCARVLQVDEEALGQDVECGGCSTLFVATSSESRNTSSERRKEITTSMVPSPPTKPKAREKPKETRERPKATKEELWERGERLKEKPSSRKRDSNRDNLAYDDDDFDPAPSHQRVDYRESGQKSRVTYILLGVFFGVLGVHNFYAGRIGPGVAQFLITLISIPLMFSCVGFVTIFIPIIWALVEIVAVDEDGNNVPMVM